MKRRRGYDEVMIVNPGPPGDGSEEGARLMQFGYGPYGLGYYADPYGYYEAPPGGYAAPPSGYAAPYAGYEAPYGYYAEPQPGGWGSVPAQPGGELEYAEDDPFGYWGAGYGDDGYGYGYGYGANQLEADPYAYAEPYDPSGGYGWYAEDDMGEDDFGEDEFGEGEFGEGEFAEDDPTAGYGYSGYVRGGQSPFNAGCPIPTNVAGFGEAETVEGYGPPPRVGATCDRFTAQGGGPAEAPETFRPLW